MDHHLQMLAAQQADVVAAWQLRAAGWSPDRVAYHAKSRAWRRLHPGVYLLSQAAPTRVQLWWAAALSAPRTFLSIGSAAACFGFYRFDKPFEVVTRPGRGGKRRQGRLLVFRSITLEGETTTRMGIPITTAERTLVDLARGLDDKRAGRCFREALRLRTTTIGKIGRCVARHRGPAVLAGLAERYSGIPYARTRSDAEALALERLHDAGFAPPLVNSKVAGEEADLVWPAERLIVEIDGPQFHQFREEDARKERVWRDAGYAVRRVPSGVVYDDPTEFIARCRA